MGGWFAAAEREAVADGRRKGGCGARVLGAA